MTASLRTPKEAFDFRPHLLNGIQIGTVRRQILELGTRVALTGLDQASLLLVGENPDNHLSAAEVIDFNGDALPDLYQSKTGASSPFEFDLFYTNRGEGVFERVGLSEEQSLELRIQGRNSFVMDINGDGLSDLVAQKGLTKDDLAVRLNEGGRWADADIAIVLPSGQSLDNVFRGPEVRLLDLDFDKRVDTLRSYITTDLSGTGVVFAAHFAGMRNWGQRRT